METDWNQKTFYTIKSNAQQRFAEIARILHP
jgi:hypothetical protein